MSILISELSTESISMLGIFKSSPVGVGLIPVSGSTFSSNLDSISDEGSILVSVTVETPFLVGETDSDFLGDFLTFSGLGLGRLGSQTCSLKLPPFKPFNLKISLHTSQILNLIL